MDDMIRINRSVGRAEKIGLTVAQLCARAGLNPGTVYRWLQDGETANPRMQKLRSTAASLETAVAEAEREQLAYLLDLHPDFTPAASQGLAIATEREGAAA